MVIENKKRIEWIDTAKGFCIMLVILNHLAYYSGTIYIKNDIFGVFRMPLYFILSGLFFKRYSGFMTFMVKKINKLVIPYIFFFVIGGVIIPVITYRFWGLKIWEYKFYSFEAFSYIFSEKKICNGPIWFLVCLFHINIIFYILMIIVEKIGKEIYVILPSLLLGFWGLLLSYYRLDLPYYIDSALSVTPFFCAGWFLRNHTNFLYRSYSFRDVIYTILLIIISVFLFGKYRYVHPSIIDNIYSTSTIGYLQLYPYGILGTITLLSISHILGKIPIISYIGRYSLIVLCTHAYSIQLASFFLSGHINNKLQLFWTEFIFIILLSIIIIKVLKKYIPYFTAQKDIIRISQ